MKALQVPITLHLNTSQRITKAYGMAKFHCPSDVPVSEDWKLGSGWSARYFHDDSEVRYSGMSCQRCLGSGHVWVRLLQKLGGSFLSNKKHPCSDTPTRLAPAPYLPPLEVPKKLTAGEWSVSPTLTRFNYCCSNIKNGLQREIETGRERSEGLGFWICTSVSRDTGECPAHEIANIQSFAGNQAAVLKISA